MVSCPHYLGEIVIYAGLLMAYGRHSGLPWLIFLWVVSSWPTLDVCLIIECEQVVQVVCTSKCLP